MSLEARNATVQLGGACVLEDVSVRVEAGAVTAVIGPNGAGKSTLLRVLGGELQPSAGSVRLNDRPLAATGVGEQSRQRAVMLQPTPIAFDFFVSEVLAMGWVRGGAAQASATAAIDAVARDCAIDTLLERKFNTLSSGERQRVQFARALLQIWQPPHSAGAGHAEPANQQRYLLLDEPTSNLDIGQELKLLRLVRRTAAQHVGVLAVLHDLNLAARFADTVLLLDAGRAVAAGPPEEIFTAQRLSRVYRTPVAVERHRELDRLVVHT